MNRKDLRRLYAHTPHTGKMAKSTTFYTSNLNSKYTSTFGITKVKLDRSSLGV